VAAIRQFVEVQLHRVRRDSAEGPRARANKDERAYIGVVFFLNRRTSNPASSSHAVSNRRPGVQNTRRLTKGVDKSMKGIAHFDLEPSYPSMALLLDCSNVLILQEKNPGGAFVRLRILEADSLCPFIG
jgi:hypothetical protein